MIDIDAMDGSKGGGPGSVLAHDALSEFVTTSSQSSKKALSKCAVFNRNQTSGFMKTAFVLIVYFSFIF
jgi:hypothetical protein